MAAEQAKPETEPFEAEAVLSPSRALVPYAVKLNGMIVKQGFWPKIRRLALHVPFAEQALAMFFCAVDRETPATTKGILLAALAYFVLPTDAIADFLPGLGFTDDAAVLTAAFAAASRHIQPRHQEKAREALEKIAGGPRELPAA